jgi:hypothetical protein
MLSLSTLPYGLLTNIILEDAKKFHFSKIMKKSTNKRCRMNRLVLVPITDGSEKLEGVAIIDVLRQVKAIVLTGYPGILGLLVQRIIPGRRPLYLHIYSVLPPRYRW